MYRFFAICALTLSLLPLSASAEGKDYVQMCKDQLSAPNSPKRELLIRSLVNPSDYCTCLGEEVDKWVKQGGRVMIGVISKEDSDNRFEILGYRRGDAKCMQKLMWRDKPEAEADEGYKAN